MFKTAFRFVIPCASIAFAVLLLTNYPLPGLVGAEAVQPQDQPAAPAAGSTSGTRKTIDVKRPPARVIRDPNSSFSAVAVDVEIGRAHV